MRKPVTIDVDEEVLEKINVAAKQRGLEFEEMIRFTLGESFLTAPTHTPGPPKTPQDPMEILGKLMAATGMAKCRECSLQLTFDEIIVNGDKCFKCVPDTRNLEF